VVHPKPFGDGLDVPQRLSGSKPVIKGQSQNPEAIRPSQKAQGVRAVLPAAVSHEDVKGALSRGGGPFTEAIEQQEEFLPKPFPGYWNPGPVFLEIRAVIADSIFVETDARKCARQHAGTAYPGGLAPRLARR
jgi:hypothetical protein